MNWSIYLFLTIVYLINKSKCATTFVTSEHTKLLSILNEACYASIDKELGNDQIKRVEKKLKQYRDSFPATIDTLKDVSVSTANDDYTVFINGNKKLVYYVFRGTKLSKISDLLNDLQFFVAPITTRVVWAYPSVQIGVALWKDNGYKVIISGHSLGGAMALSIYTMISINKKAYQIDYCEVHNPLITEYLYDYMNIIELMTLDKAKMLIHYTIGDRLRLLYKTLEFKILNLDAQISEFQVPSKIITNNFILGKHSALGLFAKCYLDNGDNSSYYANLETFLNYNDSFSCDEPSAEKRIIQNVNVCPCLNFSAENNRQYGIGIDLERFYSPDNLLSKERFELISKDSDTLTFKETRKLFDKQMKIAQDRAEKIFPNFKDKIEQNVQAVILDLFYSFDIDKLSKIINLPQFKEQINSKEYLKASDTLVYENGQDYDEFSKYCKINSQRCIENAFILSKCASNKRNRLLEDNKQTNLLKLFSCVYEKQRCVEDMKCLKDGKCLDDSLDFHSKMVKLPCINTCFQQFQLYHYFQSNYQFQTMDIIKDKDCISKSIVIDAYLKNDLTVKQLVTEDVLKLNQPMPIDPLGILRIVPQKYVSTQDTITPIIADALKNNQQCTKLSQPYQIQQTFYGVLQENQHVDDIDVYIDYIQITESHKCLIATKRKCNFSKESTNESNPQKPTPTNSDRFSDVTKTFYIFLYPMNLLLIMFIFFQI